MVEKFERCLISLLDWLPNVFLPEGTYNSKSDSRDRYTAHTLPSKPFSAVARTYKED